MITAFKCLVTWFAFWMVVACPLWGNSDLTAFGLKMAVLAMIGAVGMSVVALWRLP